MLREEKGDEAAVESVGIPRAAVEEGVAFYTVAVGGAGGARWAVRKRYSQFEEMWARLAAAVEPARMPRGAAMPPKKIKLFGSNVQPKFVEERRVLLENLLRKLVAGRHTASAPALVAFLDSDRVDEPAELGDRLPPPVEDAEITDVCIPSSRSMSDHVLYQIDVSNERKRKTFSKWTVLKRFGQFHEMDAALRASFAEEPEFLASLPASPARKSKLLQDHMDPAFIEERRALMEHYLRRLVRIERVVKNDGFLQFMGVR